MLFTLSGNCSAQRWKASHKRVGRARSPNAPMAANEEYVKFSMFDLNAARALRFKCGAGCADIWSGK
jgi:hypothetical protein